jgi:hypothetical protein
MSSENRDSLTSSLPTISSSCLIALARSSKTMLNENGESGHLYLAPDFKGNGFSFSPLNMTLAMGLSHKVYFVEVASFYS